MFSQDMGIFFEKVLIDGPGEELKSHHIPNFAPPITDLPHAQPVQPDLVVASTQTSRKCSASNLGHTSTVPGITGK